MPHIADLLQDIGRYSYVSALDLSMGYYHFKLARQEVTRHVYLCVVMGTIQVPTTTNGIEYQP